LKEYIIQSTLIKPQKQERYILIKKYLLKTRPSLQKYVVEKLELGWSPEQIAGRLREKIKEGKRPSTEYINHESIYQYLYDVEQRDLRLWEKLPRSHKKRYRWLGRRSWSVKIPHRISIADPYSSWQRGTNEYTNKLLRRYYPKRTEFRDLSQNDLNDSVLTE
jgi:IS30 family transposase